MRNIRESSLKGKNVLVRCDFNVPFSGNGKTLDDFRIKAAIPTINYLKQKGARVILMSHLEHGGKLLSLQILIPRLEELLQNKIFFLKDYLSDDMPERLSKIDSSKIILLENLRLHKEEKQNDSEFARKLSRLGDIYVNEAFSVCHRKHASVCAITKFMPSLAGLALKK
jgi:phosphoglycerate kinase